MKAKMFIKNKKFWLGIILSALFLWLSIKDVKWQDVQRSFCEIHYAYLILMIAALVLMNYIRAIRWRYLLIDIKKIETGKLFSIIMISNLMLSILPARIGEFIRAYLIGEKSQISKTASFATVVVERLFDGNIAMLLFIGALWFYPGDPGLNVSNIHGFSIRRSIFLLSILYITALSLFVLFAMFPEKIRKVLNLVISLMPKSINKKIDNMTGLFISGLGIFRNRHHLYLATLLTFAVWGLGALGYYAGLLSFGIVKDFYLIFIVMGFMVIGAMIPAAPGCVGTFHYAVQIALTKFLGVSLSIAFSYSWVVWTCGMAINLVAGLYYFNKENLSLKEIKI